MLQIARQIERTAGVELSLAAIIPLYNGADFIRETLESVLGQTEPVDEIIVIDDGSTDGGAGAAIVREMASVHDIRLISQANGGIGAARNRGVAECGSTHISFLDQDDLWSKNHIEVLKNAVSENVKPDLGVVYSNLDRIDLAGRMMQKRDLDRAPFLHPKTSLLQCLSHDMFILPGASLISKEAFEALGGFDERLSGYEDDDLFLRMFIAGYEMVYLRDESVLKWRLNTKSTSYTPRMAISRLIYFRKLVEAFPDEPLVNKYWVRNAIAPRFFNILMGELQEAGRLRDRSQFVRAWNDLREVVPQMRRSTRKRYRHRAFFVDLSLRLGLLRRASKIAKRIA